MNTVMRLGITERFWSKVIKGSASECWLWTGPKAGQGGYGQFYVMVTPEGKRIRDYAHRWSYEQTKGPIPEGLTIDHLCRNRLCVNPAHLEAVTFQENQARRRGIKTGPYNVGTHCPAGHERTPENIKLNHRGVRVCVACSRIWQSNYDKKRRPRQLINQ